MLKPHYPMIGLRAEGGPQQLREIVRASLQDSANRAKLTMSPRHIEAFRPGRPVPTHRLAAV